MWSEGRKDNVKREKHLFCAGVVTACLSVLCCPADRGDSGERQACAETELGWQRDKYREGDHRWEIDSGKDDNF